MACDVSHERLQLWLDGETPAPDVAAHVARCSGCSAQIERWRTTGDALRSLAAELDDVDPLRGLMAIRERMERSPSFRGRMLQMWPAHRWVLAGMVAALVVGLVTPRIVDWFAGDGESAAVAVVVESVKVEKDARAVVYRAHGGSTTIIWVEPKE